MTFDAIKYINSPQWSSPEPGLERINLLLQKLGNPEKLLKFVHVAGTNGKGSVCEYINEILVCAGYKVGLFTSPFIWNFEERIKINNVPISGNRLTEVTLQVKAVADMFPENNHPTEFELMTAIGLLYFAQEDCDIVVLEVGMGGLMDSTNAVPASSVEVSVICRIGIDHTNYLGNSLVEIAREKAGIIKQGRPVVVWPQEPEAAEIVYSQAEKLDCAVQEPDFASLSVEKVDLTAKTLIRSFTYKSYKNLQTKMLAVYQPNNAAMAIETVEELRRQGYQISTSDIFSGISSARWSVRFDVVDVSPYVIVDGGHNVQGVEALVNSMNDVFPGKEPIFIMGVLADKEYKPMVKRISSIAKSVFTITPPNSRALDAQSLSQEFVKYGINTQPCSTMKEAVVAAKKVAKENDVLCAFGSLYSAGAIYNLFYL